MPILKLDFDFWKKEEFPRIKPDADYEKWLEDQILAEIKAAPPKKVMRPWSESQLLAMVDGDMTNWEIAEFFGCSVETVKNRLIKLYRAHGVSRRKQLLEKMRK
jgi:DNA-binding NarL/FixJ family response regulator